MATANTSKKKRRNSKRDAERLVANLRTRCYNCYDTTQESSIPTPCCDKYIHESCLAKTFYLTPSHRVCPFCRATLIPLNAGESLPSHHHGFILHFVNIFFHHERDDSRRVHSEFYQEEPPDFQRDWVPEHPRLGLPVPPGPRALGFDGDPQEVMRPPSGWHEFMNHER